MMKNKANSSIFQVSLLQGLASGDFCGSISTGELKNHGDAGIGTFDGMNGELIMLDGEIYRVSGDGTVGIVPDDETTPFAVVSFIDADVTETFRDIPDFDALERELNVLVNKNGANRFYMIRIDGIFRSMNLRSINAQKKPYRRLSEVLVNDQTFFNYENIEGTLIGIYCPPYMASLNAEGWHLHFISEDKTRGGHVLNLNINEAQFTMSAADSFELRLPRGEMFSQLNLTDVGSAEIEKIEKNR